MHIINMELNKTPEQICSAIAVDLKSRGLTHQQVADMIGKSKDVVSTQISGKRRFSREMATLFAMALQYNRNFLLYGEGELKDENMVRGLVRVPTVGPEMNIDVSVLSGMVSVAGNLLRVLGDEDALEAWNAMCQGDFQKYDAAINRLYARLGRKNFFTSVMAQYVCEKVSGQLVTTFVPIM